MTKKGFTYLDYSVDVFHSISEERCEVRWNTFKGEFLTDAYLKVLEASNPSDLYFRYLVISNSKNEVCGIAYFQLLKFTGKNVQFKKNLLLSFLIDFTLSIRPFKLLICGNLFAVNFTPYCFHEENISLEDLSRIIDHYTQLEKSDAVLLKDLGNDSSNQLLFSLGYQNYSTDLTMCMDILGEWKSIADYEKALSKKYRKRFEKISKAGLALKRVDLGLSEIEKYSNTLFELYKQVSAKQTISMGLIHKNYFCDFKKSFPEKFKIIGYFEGEKLIAFSSYIDRDILMEVHYIGMNYSFNEKYNLYFNILFDSLEMAILSGKKLLELGRTAREAKANLGGHPVYFNDFMKLNSKLAIKAANWFGANFQQSMGDEWMKRNPFRK